MQIGQMAKRIKENEIKAQYTAEVRARGKRAAKEQGMNRAERRDFEKDMWHLALVGAGLRRPRSGRM